MHIAGVIAYSDGSYMCACQRKGDREREMLRAI